MHYSNVSEARFQLKPKSDRGFLVFANTSEVIRAENLLKAQGWGIRVMGPPPEIRSGCDLVVEFPLIEGLKIKKILEDAGIPPLQMVPVGPLAATRGPIPSERLRQVFDGPGGQYETDG